MSTDSLIVSDAIERGDWKALATNKQRFMYQVRIGAGHPHYWEIMNFARAKMGKPEYIPQLKKKIEEAENWLKSNESHPKYNKAVARYEKLCDHKNVV